MTDSINNKTTITGLILAAIAIVGTLASSLTYNLTADTIARNNQQAAIQLFDQVLPSIEYNNDIINDFVTVTDIAFLGNKKPQAIHIAKLDDKPVGVIINTTAPNGYNGNIKLLVGINANHIVTGVRVVTHKETPSLGDGIEAKKSDWILAFEGKSLANLPIDRWKVKKDGGDFDQMTGATITPRAVVGAVLKAQQYFEANKTTLFNTTIKPKKGNDS